MTRIPRAVVDAMVAHAREGLPNEVCGMVHGKDGVATEAIRVTNTAASPYRYEMHPLEMMRLESRRDETGETLFAIYHSHVASQAKPSPTDVRNAFFPPGEVTQPPMFPATFYILVSLAEEPPSVRAWRAHSAADVDAAIAALEEEPIEVV